MSDKLLKPKEAAKFLRSTAATLATWRSSKQSKVKIPYIKIGKKVLYRQKDLEKFIEENLEKS